MIEVACNQGTREWAEARRGVPTASCADKIITPAKGDLSKSANGYACQLLAEMMVPAHYWIEDGYESRDMANGKTVEEEARDYLALELGAEIREVGFVLTDDKRFGCSPDGLIDPDDGVELKCPKHSTQIKYLLDGVLPVEYRPQVHWSLVVTKRPVWHFMSYAVGLPPLIVRVESDEYTVKVAEAMETFWVMLSDMRSRLDCSDPVAASRELVDSYF